MKWIILLFITFSFSQEKTHISDKLLKRFLNKGLSKEKVFFKRKSVLSDTSDFFVRNIINQSKWDTIAFYKIANSENAIIWLEKSLSELDQNRIKSKKDELVDFIEVKTPSKSIDSTKGMIELSQLIYGDTPNSDGDNKVDILLLDIRDRFLIDGAYVAGFFDPIDQTNEPISNKRDIIYIDVFPGIIYKDTILSLEPALQTLAHEYQHLIHFNYEKEAEITFLNEGLSELSEILHGFSGRDPKLYLSAINQDFLSWGKASTVLIDYQRAALFHFYLYEKYGIEVVKKICQDSDVGYQSYQTIFNGYNTNLEKVVEEFHLTNLLNKKSNVFHYSAERAGDYETKNITVISELPFVKHTDIEAGALLIIKRNGKLLTRLNTSENVKEFFIKDERFSNKEEADYLIYYNDNFTQAISHQFELFELDSSFNYQIRYDDGNPDAVAVSTFLFRNAGIGQGFKLSFQSLGFSANLKEISIFALFDSELEEWESEKKAQKLEIYDENEILLYKDTLKWLREDAVIAFKNFPLKKVLRIDPETRISVQLTNVDTNYANIAVDYKKEASNSYLVYPDGSTVPFVDVNYLGSSMKDFNIMVYLSANVEKKIKYKKMILPKLFKDSIQFTFAKNYETIRLIQTNEGTSSSVEIKNSSKLAFTKNIKNKYFIEAIYGKIHSDIYRFSFSSNTNTLLNELYGQFKIKTIKARSKELNLFYKDLVRNQFLTIKAASDINYSIDSKEKILILNNKSWLNTKANIFSGNNSFRISTDTTILDYFTPNILNYAVSNAYPNPTSKLSCIDLQGSQDSYYKVEVFNSIGQLVFSKMREEFKEVNRKITINWEDLHISSSLYFIRVTFFGSKSEKRFTQKILYLK